MRGKARFAYIVQLDLPNEPVKVGQSGNPVARFDCFNASTPVAARMIGCTTNGIAREKEMLAATQTRVLKGEWREPTAALLQLVLEYHSAGEWFTRTDDVAALWERENVREILLDADARAECAIKRKPSPRVMESFYVRRAVERAFPAYPLLGLHVCGFDRARSAPSLVWPRLERMAA